MSTSFDPTTRNVLITTFLFGPRTGHEFNFIIDTGATQTCVRPDILRALGCNLDRPVSHVRVRSATGGGRFPVYLVPRIVALGHTRTDFPIAAQELPVSVAADGLLGLDFFRGHILKLDFARGRASLAAPSRWRFWR